MHLGTFTASPGCLKQTFEIFVSYLTRLFFLADHIDERAICNAVSPTKDVDGFHVVNVGRMCLDQSTMLPATPWGVWEIIKRTGNGCDYSPSFRVLGLESVAAQLIIRFASFRYTNSWEECCGCRTVQECGNAHRYVTAYGRPSREARRLVRGHAGFILHRGFNKYSISSKCYFCCRWCHSYNFSPLHSKGATSSTH